jgi:antitoxin ParD1/3/4
MAFRGALSGMTISLTAEQQAWIDARIKRGEFTSTEDAARQLIEERISERDLEEIDDMLWARPYVDEALEAVKRGEFVTVQEHQARMDAHVASMKD